MRGERRGAARREVAQRDRRRADGDAEVEGAQSRVDDVGVRRGGNRPEDRIFSWEKVQELRSGKYTLWDHCFELPHKHLEADKPIQESVQVGEVTHKLKVANNDRLEFYDYPGAYAQRFDGIDKGGGITRF